MIEKLAKYRKAIAAGVTPLLSLPLAGWIAGDVPFEQGVLVGAIIGSLSAVLTWRFPNAA
jgi:hypothetical protein